MFELLSTIYLDFTTFTKSHAGEAQVIIFDAMQGKFDLSQVSQSLESIVYIVSLTGRLSDTTIWYNGLQTEILNNKIIKITLRSAEFKLVSSVDTNCYMIVLFENPGYVADEPIVTILNINDINLDNSENTKEFYTGCSEFTQASDDTISRAPGNIFSYTQHQTLRYIKPFRYANRRAVRLSIDYAKKWLPSNKRDMIDSIMNWCTNDALPIINTQFDQTFIIIHGNGQSVLPHKHGTTDGNVVITYCIKVTPYITAASPNFCIENETIAVFEEGSCASRFIFNARELTHSVVVDPADKNYYMWVGFDGVTINDCNDHPGRVTVTRYPKVCRTSVQTTNEKY
jgi:hypothetical protein